GSSCSAAAGGGITINAYGTVTAPIPDGGFLPLYGGAGGTGGSVLQKPRADGDGGRLGISLPPSLTLLSLPRSTTASRLLVGGLGTTDPASFFGASLLVSPSNAGPFVPLRHAVGQPLASGWRYQVLVQPRMFDPSGVDGMIVRLK